jgi:hypothetical protein
MKGGKQGGETVRRHGATAQQLFFPRQGVRAEAQLPKPAKLAGDEGVAPGPGFAAEGQIQIGRWHGGTIQQS